MIFCTDPNTTPISSATSPKRKAYVGVQQSTVAAVASIEEALARNALIAFSHAGEPIPAGGSGPYWLIYPEAPGDARRPGLGPPPLPRLLELRIH